MIHTDERVHAACTARACNGSSTRCEYDVFKAVLASFASPVSLSVLPFVLLSFVSLHSNRCATCTWLEIPSPGLLWPMALFIP